MEKWSKKGRKGKKRSNLYSVKGSSVAQYRLTF
jgi:hypothetical protein